MILATVILRLIGTVAEKILHAMLEEAIVTRMPNVLATSSVQVTIVRQIIQQLGVIGVFTPIAVLVSSQYHHFLRIKTQISSTP